MWGRMVLMLHRVARSFRSSLCKSERIVRRSLVPDRFSGPKAISVYYRVESLSQPKVKTTEQLLRAYHRLFTQTLPGAVTMTDKAAAVIVPPAAVRGMKTLDRSLFSTTVSVPALRVPSKHISALTKTMRVALLRLQRVKPVAELAQDDPLHGSHKLFLLDPGKFSTARDFSPEEKEKLEGFGVSAEELTYFDLAVGYDNWGVSEILRAVLPETSEGVSGYSIIGHIAHLNLKPEVLEYKHLIGTVILDKNSSVRTVVNKVNTIDNTFRNFQMELLAGEENFVTRAKENGCVFEMDFSKVYWNPRLSTEHERVVELLKAGDVLYDVFAGVGPFAVPAAKRGVQVLANDLNPHSCCALRTNVQLNRGVGRRLQDHNMDGRQFILTVLKPDLAARLRAGAEVSGGDQSVGSGSGAGGGQRLYVAMNLPALALEFLDAFCGLLSDFPEELRTDPGVLGRLPTVLCYCFEHKDDDDDVKTRAERIMGRGLPAESRVRFVRNVAPSKEMMCLEFPLTAEVLFGEECSSVSCGESQDGEEEHPPRKRQKVTETV